MLEACEEEFDTGGTIHLPLQHLQPVDLAFGLAIGPRLTERRRNRLEICRETTGEGRHPRRLGLIPPIRQPVLLTIAEHGGEGGETLAVLRQSWQGVLDSRDEYAVGLREVVSTRGHHAGDLAAWRAFARAVRDRVLSPALARRPLP